MDLQGLTFSSLYLQVDICKIQSASAHEDPVSGSGNKFLSPSQGWWVDSNKIKKLSKSSFLHI